MSARIGIAQPCPIAGHFSNKMNKEEEGFVILIQSESAGRLLHNSKKIDESLYSLATAHRDVIYSPAS